MDHLDLGDGPVWESWTSMAALAHLVPGRIVGQLVGANPFRHPALVAKMATVMDHATGGRFVLGIGSGSWPPELSAFGFSEATDAERLRDLEAGTAGHPRAVRPRRPRDPAAGRRIPRRAALPADRRPQRSAAADAGRAADLARHAGRAGRDRACSRSTRTVGTTRRWTATRRSSGASATSTWVGPTDLGRGRAEFTISAQFLIDDHGAARDAALALGEEGCDHVILFMDPRRGPAELEAIARNIAEPVRAALPT